jgi:hypothetical protein
LGKQVPDVEVPEVERVDRGGHFRTVGVPGENVERRRILPEQPVRHDVVEYQVVRMHYVERSGHRLALERSASLGHRLFDTIDRRFVGAGADGGVDPELGERLAPPASCAIW